MGNKLERGGREEDEEEKDEVVVLFVSTLMDSILLDIRTELRRNFNIRLEKCTRDTTGPVLDIRDATDDDIEKLREHSRSLEPNRLLVVRVPKTRVAESSERLVVLKKSVDYSKQQAAVNAILQFIKNTRPSSITPDGQGVVHVTFGQPNPEELLKKAVKFLQDHISDRKFELVTRYTSSASASASCSLDVLSPLIVVCKTDGNFLKSDVRDAVKMTRSGSDVMLLVVTDKIDLKLDRVPAEEILGAKDRLYWNHSKSTYPEKENKQALQWVRSFLDRFAAEGFSIKRKNVRDSFGSLGKTPVYGSYHSVSLIKDDLEKNTIFYLQDNKVHLTKSTQPLLTTPLVLLTTSEPAAMEEADQLLKTHTDSRSVLQVILQNPAHPQQAQHDFAGVTVTFTLVPADASGRLQPDPVENKKAVKQIKQTLARPKARGKTPADAACSSEQPRPHTSDTLGSEDGGDLSLGSSFNSTDCHLDQPLSHRRRYPRR